MDAVQQQFTINAFVDTGTLEKQHTQCALQNTQYGA